jgi:hypothetical protein
MPDHAHIVFGRDVILMDSPPAFPAAQPAVCQTSPHSTATLKPTTVQESAPQQLAPSSLNPEATSWNPVQHIAQPSPTPQTELTAKQAAMRDSEGNPIPPPLGRPLRNRNLHYCNMPSLFNPPKVRDIQPKIAPPTQQHRFALLCTALYRFTPLPTTSHRFTQLPTASHRFAPLSSSPRKQAQRISTDD